jgi:thioredoxin 1
MIARHITSDTVEREVLHSERPTRIDFYADWCGPCRIMARVVDHLADELQGRADVVRVNVDESPELARRYKVESIPTFIVVRAGRAAQKLVGAQSQQAFVSALAG